MHLPHTTLRRLSALLSALNRKPGLAILSHVYFTPVGSHTVLQASDLDLEFHWPLPTAHFNTLPKPASCPIGWFLKIAKAVRKDGHLELRLTDDGRTLCAYPSTGPSARSPEPSFPIADMPAFSTEGFTRGGWLSHDTLKHMTAAKDFLSTDETRYVITGSLITTTGHCVATDGRRLIHRATPGTLLPEDIILSAKYFAPLLEISDGELTEDGIGRFWDGQGGGTRLAVYLNGGHYPETGATFATDKMLVRSGTCLITTKMIMGNFPNWRQVVPTGFNAMADLDVAALETLRTAFSRSPARGDTLVTLHLDPDGILRADITASVKGQGTIELLPERRFPAGKHVIAMTQRHFSLSFNAHFFLTALDATGTRLRFVGDCDPILTGDPLTGEAVLMPMRTNVPDPEAVQA
jgi:DNA polymerase III sliding clamp (beta) subunit (PCNA family)